MKINVPASWKTLADDTKAPDASLPHYIRAIQIPVNKQAGDAIPVSEFMPYADGVTPSETSKYEKRGIAVKVPQWIPAELYWLQQVRSGLPPRCYPSLPAERGGRGC